MPTSVAKCEISQHEELVKDHWVSLSQLNCSLPTNRSLDLAGPCLVPISRLTYRLNRRPLVAGITAACAAIRQQSRGVELVFFQLWQHLLNKKRNKEANHSFNLHPVEAAVIENWAMLEQKAKHDQTPLVKLEPPVTVQVKAEPPSVMAVKQEPPIVMAVEQEPPVQSFQPPPRLLGVDHLSMTTLIHLPETEETVQHPIRHGQNGLAEAVCPNGQ
eukprot:3574962-Amphidinium_carterae.1